MLGNGRPDEAQGGIGEASPVPAAANARPFGAAPTVAGLVGRVATFWRRAAGIYASYKARQIQHQALRLMGHQQEELETTLWDPHHKWAGEEMYKLCVDLRGFYLKTGQFLGARPDFLPRPMCEALSKLHDEVPPMGPQQTRAVIEEELGGTKLEEVFDWIDLERPLGSASIAQVHKAQLRADYDPDTVLHRRHQRQAASSRGQGRRRGGGVVSVREQEHAGTDGEADQPPWGLAGSLLQAASRAVEDGSRALMGAWPGAAHHAVERGAAGAAVMGIKVQAEEVFQEASELGVPPEDPTSIQTLPWTAPWRSWAPQTADEGPGPAASARRGGGQGAGPAADGRPGNGSAGGGKGSSGSRKKSSHAGHVVAVKVQYPNALQLMQIDLKQIRRMASFLTQFELSFDLPSAVDELAKQIDGEFDFDREATTMGIIADRLQPLRSRVVVPRPVPGLVTRRLLAMDFLDGVPITKLAGKMEGLSPAKRKMGAHLILSRVAEAYGHMILHGGLFQADCHPGNILVMPGGKVGLLDFGQSKQLTREEIDGLARLVKVVTTKGRSDREVSEAVWDLGIVTGRTDPGIYPVVAQMAVDMFDTAGTLAPFNPNSPIRITSIDSFPKDLFFVLRTCQLLRGLKQNMGLDEGWSSLAIWRPLAEKALLLPSEENPDVRPTLQSGLF